MFHSIRSSETRGQCNGKLDIDGKRVAWSSVSDQYWSYSPALLNQELATTESAASASTSAFAKLNLMLNRAVSQKT